MHAVFFHLRGDPGCFPRGNSSFMKPTYLSMKLNSPREEAGGSSAGNVVSAGCGAEKAPQLLGLARSLALESRGAAGLCPQLLSGQSPAPARAP